MYTFPLFLFTSSKAPTPDKVIVGRIDFGDNVGGECLFIPSKPDSKGIDKESEEDDGYVATFITPIDGGKSGERNH